MIRKQCVSILYFRVNESIASWWRAKRQLAMWSDNETGVDYLNFSGVAETVAEIVVQANGRPISIGVSGAWGVGKSSMIRLVHTALDAKDKGSKFIFVEFNAWLYQGYDDARAALIEVIASTLSNQAELTKTGIDQARDLLKRVNWLRVAKLGIGSFASIAMGLPPVGLVKNALELGSELLTSGVNAETIGKANAVTTDVENEASRLVAPKAFYSPPREIDALRRSFQDTLESMGITLIVLIDDLDRCLPETTISTLEAIRLFLFLEHTAFVIAADDGMIKHAVRRHFNGIDDEHVINYFDKLIQVPIRVPQLGTQEVRAYMLLLFVESSNLDGSVKEDIRQKVCKQLSATWQGKSVTSAFVKSLYKAFDDPLIGQFDLADRLAPLMTTASDIRGNPRLIKRFLNALSVRMSISNAHGVGVDEAVLAKMLLFERLGSPKAYDELTAAVNSSSDGKPTSLLSKWEEESTLDEKPKLPADWDHPFIREWLTLPPRLSDYDLRGVLYVSREHAPVISPLHRLSEEAVSILDALLKNPTVSDNLLPRLRHLPVAETGVIMSSLIDKAKQEQSWGVPPILDACIVVAESDPTQARRLAAFLLARPAAQIRPNIVPKIDDRSWAKAVLDSWLTNQEVAQPVRKAINTRRESGNVSV
jgi:predicted KAP-like P-loop ATPase